MGKCLLMLLGVCAIILGIIQCFTVILIIPGIIMVVGGLGLIGLGGR